MGNFKNAIRFFDAILEAHPGSHAWFSREIALQHWKKLDHNILSYNIDKEVHPDIKEGHAITSKDPQDFKRDFPDYESFATKYRDALEAESDLNEIPTHSPELLLLTAELARWVQLDSPGFIANKRHQRMFGIAVLQAAQALRTHVNLLKNSGRGFEVPDSFSSRTSIATPSTDQEQSHIFGWRDFFEMIIRWRQVSAFGDAVWWTDLFTKKNITDRHGLTTWILDGSGLNVRYIVLTTLCHKLRIRSVTAHISVQH